MRLILVLGLTFFAGLWFSYHFNMRRPVEKFDNILAKVIEEIKKP